MGWFKKAKKKFKKWKKKTGIGKGGLLTGLGKGLSKHGSMLPPPLSTIATPLGKAMEKGGKQMSKDAAKKEREEARIAKGGGGGCCWTFLEAHDGTMSPYVRLYRDEYVTPQNRNGYKKLSSVLVPLMQDSKIIRSLVRNLMTKPLAKYGEYHYTQKGIGWIFKPLGLFWMKIWNRLGKHQLPEITS